MKDQLDCNNVRKEMGALKVTPGFWASATVWIAMLFMEMGKFGVTQIGEVGIKLFWSY